MYHSTGVICHDGDVRLVNGSGPHEGRVEVCFNETWGTICGYIDPWDWNVTQADVVCQQLGYSGAGTIIIVFASVSHAYNVVYVITVIERSTFDFGRGSLPILVTYVFCQGYESNIGECTYYTSTTWPSDCLRYGGIIGVQCISSII